MDGCDPVKPPPMHEKLLPPGVLAKASLQGFEYAWRLQDIAEVIEAARSIRLASLSGQIQLRLPLGTCELYWHSADATPRKLGEPWMEYVRRSADEVLACVDRFPSVSELVSEGTQTFTFLDSSHSSGVDLEKYLYMVLYFNAEIV